MTRDRICVDQFVVHLRDAALYLEQHADKFVCEHAAADEVMEQLFQAVDAETDYHITLYRAKGIRKKYRRTLRPIKYYRNTIAFGDSENDKIEIEENSLWKLIERNNVKLLVLVDDDQFYEIEFERYSDEFREVPGPNHKDPPLPPMPIDQPKFRG